MRYETFKSEALGRQCRRCINQKYELQLEQEDCEYWSYPACCDCCGEVRNIVIDVDLFSRWKIWRLRKKK